MECALEAILGNHTAAGLMLHLFHYGEANPNGAARELGIALGPVQRQLEKFEAAGLLVSRLVGRTRVYTFNPKHSATKSLRQLARPIHEHRGESVETPAWQGAAAFSAGNDLSGL